jgi:hypothetical protein
MDVAVINVPVAVYVIWWIMLVVAVVVVLPVVVWLLHRILTAARSIKSYTETTLEAGVGIVHNTASVAALRDTIAVATQLLESAKAIEEHAAIIQKVLTERAGGVPAGGPQPPRPATLEDTGSGSGGE